MPREARVKSKSGIYHVILRGANRQEIFHDDEDRIMFLQILFKCKMKSDMKVYAWCLMNNHLHLVLKEGKENLSVTMKRLGVSYVCYYHSKYNTTGHLFQDRFKSECVETNKYLLTVIRYIHQNPVKAGMVLREDDWKWSSCLGYYNQARHNRDLLDKQDIFQILSKDFVFAQQIFRTFNSQRSTDECLEESESKRRRFTDDEARKVIQGRITGTEIAVVKSLPSRERNELLKQIKSIKGISQRQAARILGVSENFIFKA